jgi:hypothetical protein
MLCLVAEKAREIKRKGKKNSSKFLKIEMLCPCYPRLSHDL